MTESDKGMTESDKGMTESDIGMTESAVRGEHRFSGQVRISHPDKFGHPGGDCPDFSAFHIRVPRLHITVPYRTLSEPTLS